MSPQFYCIKVSFHVGETASKVLMRGLVVVVAPVKIYELRSHKFAGCENILLCFNMSLTGPHKMSTFSFVDIFLYITNDDNDQGHMHDVDDDFGEYLWEFLRLLMSSWDE